MDLSFGDYNKRNQTFVPFKNKTNVAYKNDQKDVICKLCANLFPLLKKQKPEIIIKMRL